MLHTGAHQTTSYDTAVRIIWYLAETEGLLVQASGEVDLQQAGPSEGGQQLFFVPTRRLGASSFVRL